MVLSQNQNEQWIFSSEGINARIVEHCAQTRDVEIKFLPKLHIQKTSLCTHRISSSHLFLKVP